jgi:hypothetical protein
MTADWAIGQAWPKQPSWLGWHCDYELDATFHRYPSGSLKYPK